MSAPTADLDGDPLAQSLADLMQVMEAAPAAAEQVGRDAAVVALDLRWKRLFANVILAVGTILVLFLIAIVLLFDQFGVIGDKVTNQDAALQRSQVSIDTLKAQFEGANAKLVAQGLPPVPGPTDVRPGTPEQAQLSVAAATATTLASLPKQTITNGIPTANLAGAAAKAVADYFAANPVAVAGPTPQQVIDGVAAYLAAHPAPAGPQGPAGPAGPPPTSEEITNAFRKEVSANPQVLCPIGGVYGSRSLALAGGGSTTQFGCFSGDAPASGGADPGGGTGDTGGAGGAGNTGGGGAATPPSATTTAAPAPATEAPAPAQRVQPQVVAPAVPAPVTDDPGPAPVTTSDAPAPLVPLDPGGILGGLLG